MGYVRSESNLRWAVLALACCCVFGSYYIYDNPAALKNNLQAYLGISNTQFNWLYSIYSFPNVILPFFGGFLVDRMGPNLMVLIFLVLICIGQCIFAIASTIKSYALCLVGRAVFGFGGESLSVGQSTLLALWFRGKEMALAMGLNLSIARLGSVVNDQSSPAIYSARGDSIPAALWLGFFVCCFSLSSAVVLVLLEKWADKKAKQDKLAEGKDPKDDIPTEQVNLGDVRYFPRVYWLLCASCVIVYAAVLPFNNIAEGLLEDKYDFDQSTADRYLAIPFFISACCSPFLGGIVDKFGHRAHLMAVSACSLMLAHVLLAFTHIQPAVCLVIIGISYSIYAAVVWPSVAFVVEEHQLGTAYGLITAVQNAGLAVAPLLVGQIQDSTCIDNNDPDPKKARCVCVTHCVVGTELFFVGVAAVGVFIGVLLNLEDARMGGVLNKAQKKDKESDTPSDPLLSGNTNGMNNVTSDSEAGYTNGYGTEVSVNNQTNSTYRATVD